MKQILKIEHIAAVLLGMVGFWTLGLSWWWFVGLLLAPDVSMLGYFFGSRFGAAAYNLFHHVGLAVTIGLAGWAFDVVALELAGIMLFTHAHMDRVLGYGLKYPDHFRHTHMGWLGGRPTNGRTTG